MAIEWSYEGDTGPAHWADLSPAYVAAAGSRQSPIDLPGGTGTAHRSLGFDYHTSPMTVTEENLSLVATPTHGGSVTFGGLRYDLESLHFHLLGEHTVDGSASVMEAHLVHRSGPVDLLVVAVRGERGEPNPEIDRILERDAAMDAAGLLPGDTSRFWTYTGSLTTPPCTEGVVWVVMKETLPVSKEQLGGLARFCKGNRRPTQPLNGRTVISVG